MLKKFLLSVGVLGILIQSAPADEGMWLYNQPPLQALQQRYGFTPSAQWLEHLQKSSVRFNSGGSGSFVSANGLVMTNHHVAADAIQKLSDPQHDYIGKGFYAPTQAQELRCLDLELNVLHDIEDVTEKVRAAHTPGMTDEAAEKARRAVINQLEQESAKSTGLKSEVVTLYRGGQFHLYRYKRYTDVRLVFAPELGIAFFGGDPDNFEYPRHCLDVTFFRVYENGKPVQPPHHLKWGGGVKEGDLVFVSGHPGRTDRLNTVDHLAFMRDLQYPLSLNVLRRLEVMLNTFSERSHENARQSQDERFGVQNSRKARLGGLQGLQDPAVMQGKKRLEDALRQTVSGNPALAKEYGDAWDIANRAVSEWRSFYHPYYLLEGGRGFNTRLFRIARHLVRLEAERSKPNAERLHEYADANRQSLELELFSQAPIYPQFEEVKLADSLAMLLEMLGPNDPVVQQVLAGKSPRQRAAELIAGTRLRDVNLRRQLAQGLAGSNDPMIELARGVDVHARPLRHRYEQKVEEPLQQAYGKIARARLAAGGHDLYPDATFTLRMAFGKVAGYGGLPYTTRLRGLYETEAAHRGQFPYRVPESWARAKSKLNLDTPFNFVCTADIIGGNSGSPVVDRTGDVVGLIFDGNIESLVLDFLYTEDRARALAVDTRAIVEALTKVYGASGLAAELTRS